MSILTLDDYILSKKQPQVFYKSGTAATLAAVMGYTVFDRIGEPAAGVLDVGNPLNGIVHTDEVAGYPVIDAFSDGARGYLSKIEFSSSIACRLALYDRLFVAGAYLYYEYVALESQPSFASRVPDGVNFSGLELWIETVTAFTGVPSFNIEYLDQDGNDGITDWIAAPAALTIRRCFQLPLASGDNGIQKIKSVYCTGSSAGSFNVMVLRPLWAGRIPIVGFTDVNDMLKTGLIEIFADSALYVIIAADSTSSGLPWMQFEVVNK